MADTPEAPAANDSNPLDGAGKFIASVLGTRKITDALSGTDIPLPVKNVEIATDTMRGGDGIVKQSLHFKIEGDAKAELNQAAILKSAEAVFAQIPSLAQHFSFGGTPTPEKPLAGVHNWRDDRILDVKFDLPQGVEPAVVVKEILAMAQGASLAASPAQPSAPEASAAEAPATTTPAVVGPATERVVNGTAPVLTQPPIGDATKLVAEQREKAANQNLDEAGRAAG